MPPRGMPGLGGRGLRVYRCLWLAALAAAIAVTAAAHFHSFAPAKLLHAIVLIAVAATLFRRRPTDPVAAILSFAFLLWAATAHPAWAAMTGGEIVLAVLDRVRFLLFVTAMLLFPAGNWRPRWTLHAAVATFVIFVVGLMAAAGLVPVTLYQPLAMACAALAVAALRQRFRELPPGMQRQQIKWVALGLGAGLILVAISRLGALLAPALAEVASGLLYDAGVIVMAFGVLVSLLRYRLYDADAAISRSTAYAMLTVGLVAIFAAGEAAIQVLSQSWFGDHAGAISGGIAAALAAALIAPLHHRVTNWTEQRFQQGLVALRRELPPLISDLRESAGLAALAEAALEHIERALRPLRAVILVDGAPVAARNADPDRIRAWAEVWTEPACALDCDTNDDLFPLRIPLRVEGEPAIGWILLGSRPDGSLHGKDEREALAEIAGPLARAVRIVRWREGREASEARLAKRLAARIAVLTDRVAALEALSRIRTVSAD